MRRSARNVAHRNWISSHGRGRSDSSCFTCAEYDAAIRELRVRKDIQPHDIFIRHVLADAYLFAGRTPEFIEELSEAAEAQDGNAAGAVESAGPSTAAGLMRLRH